MSFKHSKWFELKDWSLALVEALFILFIIKKFLFGLYYVPSGSAEPNLLVGDRVFGNKLSYYFKPVQRNDYVIFDSPTFDYHESTGLQRWWQKNIGITIPLFGITGGPENMVKRVIGIPGDVIEGRVEHKKAVIYRNGEKLEEFYANPYPLVRVRKEIGFIKSKYIGIFSTPDCLRRRIKNTYYTFDIKKPCKDQSFYKLEEHELIRNRKTGKLCFAKNLIFKPSDSGGRKSVDIFGPITIPPGKYWVMGDNRLNSYDSRYWGLLDEKLIHGKMNFVIYSIDTEESMWFFELLKHPISFWTKKVRWNRFLSCIVK